eukprot:Rhum_TRINITY_DN14894_c12_g1::Rhum_TRINITY_DN14894_c12_g1_i1::g.126124::m.126124
MHWESGGGYGDEVGGGAGDGGWSFPLLSPASPSPPPSLLSIVALGMQHVARRRSQTVDRHRGRGEAGGWVGETGKGDRRRGGGGEVENISPTSVVSHKPPLSPSLSSPPPCSFSLPPSQSFTLSLPPTQERTGNTRTGEVTTGRDGEKAGGRATVGDRACSTVLSVVVADERPPPPPPPPQESLIRDTKLPSPMDRRRCCDEATEDGAFDDAAGSLLRRRCCGDRGGGGEVRRGMPAAVAAARVRRAGEREAMRRAPAASTLRFASRNSCSDSRWLERSSARSQRRTTMSTSSVFAPRSSGTRMRLCCCGAPPPPPPFAAAAAAGWRGALRACERDCFPTLSFSFPDGGCRADVGWCGWCCCSAAAAVGCKGCAGYPTADTSSQARALRPPEWGDVSLPPSASGTYDTSRPFFNTPTRCGHPSDPPSAAALSFAVVGGGGGGSGAAAPFGADFRGCA